MSTIIFETPGLIDTRAFTMLGMSTKPNHDHPIGQFGTGLKYAIAVLVRLGIEPVVWIGRDQYVFYKEKSTFRGQEFEQIKMRAKKFPQRLFRSYDLPYTTEYGKFWKPWQVFRELEANTRDENGNTSETNVSAHDVTNNLGYDRTLIIVEHPEFYEAWQNRDEIFLPKASAVVREDSTLEVFEGESKFLYYRGMRVFELSKPSMFTYNIVRHVELTEDRTLKYEFCAQEYLGEFATKSNNRDFLTAILTAPDSRWEHGMTFDWSSNKPSDVFRSVVREKPSGLLSRASAYSSRYDPVEEPEENEDPHPLPWKVRGDWIEDANGTNIFQKPDNYDGDWNEIAEEVVKKCAE